MMQVLLGDKEYSKAFIDEARQEEAVKHTLMQILRDAGKTISFFTRLCETLALK